MLIARQFGYFSFKLDAGSAELSEGKINVIDVVEGIISPVYLIENDGDAIEKEDSGDTLLNFRKGKKGTAPLASGFSVFNKNSGEFLFSMPSLEDYEKAKEKGTPLSQIIYFQSKKGLPVYIGNLESGEKFYEFIILSDVKKRSEIAAYYYNTLFKNE